MSIILNTGLKVFILVMILYRTYGDYKVKFNSAMTEVPAQAYGNIQDERSTNKQSAGLVAILVMIFWVMIFKANFFCERNIIS